MEWEVVIGLEVHVQLQTKSKIFSGAATAYGAEPNTQACAVDLGLPGVLPVLNKEAVHMATKFGLAIGAEIAPYSIFARKNYFYPDLPKGYQISQFELPIVGLGHLDVQQEDGTVKRVGITRAHLEEDAGKSVHGDFEGRTGVDLNRAGTPLLEIVSEPDIRSAKEAVAYLKTLHSLVRYIEICDGNLQEGSFRCDANVSMRPKGQKEFGTRTETKNVNSFRFVEKAINYEIERQIDVLEAGGEIAQETRLYDSEKNETRSMRSKEEANDYRYFPEPDLQAVIVTQEYIEKVKNSLPPLPSELFQKFTTEFGLSDYDANILTDEKGIALYYNELCGSTKNYKSAANFVNGSVKSYLNEKAISIAEFCIKPKRLASLITIVDQGKVSNTVATSKVFPAMLVCNDTADKIATDNNWIQESDSDALEDYIKLAIAKYPEKAKDYKEGKKGLIGLFMGEVMKLSKGQADPKLANQLLRNQLEK